MVVSRFKGLQRKRGYFNLEGDTERQMQDFEQDTDDSLRALSDQIDRVRTEAVESKEETQAEVTRVSEETSGQNAQIGELDDRVTALEAVGALWRGNFQLGQSVASGFPFLMDQQETSGNISFNGTTEVTINEDGLYTVLWSFYGTRNSTSATPSLPVSLRVNAVTVAGAVSIRYSTSSSAPGATNGAVSTRLSQGDVIDFSSGTSSLTPTINANRQTVSIAKVGE